MTNTIEEITKASQCLSMCVNDLRAALHSANPVEALVIIDLIRDTAFLAQRTESLRLAIVEINVKA